MRGFLKLENGLPSHDTFSRLFRLLDPEQFRAVFQRFMARFAQTVRGVIAIDGKVLRTLGPHEQPQRQPLVRMHPVTGQQALYMCEYGQMDWVEGPIAGLQPGPYGDGAQLLEALVTHATRPEFVYVHEWTCGDLVIWDNRCLIHAATWFDAERVQRLMWRTTVSGNPGAAYAGERKSWIATDANASLTVPVTT